MTEKAKVLFMTSRPISWVNTAFPFAAGYLMMGGGVDLLLIIGTLFFLIPYNLLMYGINDVFDYESDMRNPRKGGVEGAVTPKRFHNLIIWSSILMSAPFVVALLLLGNKVSSAVLLIILFFVLAYSAKYLRFKEIPFLDSVTSSMHFVGPLLFAYSLTTINESALWAAGAFFLWGMASQAFGAVQDILPDREAGIRSIATRIGARHTVWFSAVLYTLAVIAVTNVGIYAWPVAAAGVLYLMSTLQFIMITDKTSAMARKGWKRFLRLNYLTGAIVTMSCLVAVI